MRICCWDITVTASSGPLVHTAVAHFTLGTQPDFRIVVSPPATPIVAGQSGVYSVRVDAVNGFDPNTPVHLSLSAMPTGAVATPGGLDLLADGAYRSFTMSTSTNTPTTASFTITGTGGSKSHTIWQTLNTQNNPAGVFTVSGQVQQPNGIGIGRSTFQVRDPQNALVPICGGTSCQSDSYGNYSISLPAGQYTVTASSPLGSFSPATIAYNLSSQAWSAQHRRLNTLVAMPDPEPEPAEVRHPVYLPIGKSTLTHWYCPSPSMNAQNIQGCWVTPSDNVNVSLSLPSQPSPNFDVTFDVNANATARGREFICHYHGSINGDDVDAYLYATDYPYLVNLAMRLERVGPTVISTDGQYSEDTTVRVTAVDAETGVAVPNFVGTVDIAEIRSADGRTAYSQNGGALTPNNTGSVNITTGGTVTFVAKSLAGPRLEGANGQPPDAAIIEATNYPVYRENLTIRQWITSDSPNIDPLASGTTYDWFKKRAYDAFARAKNTVGAEDLAAVMSTVDSYLLLAMDASGQTAMSHGAAKSQIRINPFYNARRITSSVGGACGYYYVKFFEGTLFHEARHAYQASLSYKSDAEHPATNDFDEDFLVLAIPIPADDSVPPKNYFRDSTDERTVCYEFSSLDGTDGSISGPRAFQGDLLKDLFDIPGPPKLSNVRAALEMDVMVFAARWAR